MAISVIDPRPGFHNLATKALLLETAKVSRKQVDHCKIGPVINCVYSVEKFSWAATFSP